MAKKDDIIPTRDEIDVPPPPFVMARRGPPVAAGSSRVGIRRYTAEALADMHIVPNKHPAASLDFYSNEFPLRDLLGGQFFTADHVKLWQTFLGKGPHDRSSDIPVFVPKRIANTRDLSPRDLWMPGFQFVWQMAAGLRDDFNTTLDEPLSLPVCLEIIERQILHHATDALDGVDNVRQARDE